HAFTGDPDVAEVATVAMVVLAVMQLPAALTFVLDGVLMGANDFRDLRWQTTPAFAVSLPVFLAVWIWPSLGILTVWLGLLLWISVRGGKNPARGQGDQGRRGGGW